MFVYSALALGEVLSDASGGKGASNTANEYAHVARFAAERVGPCLQLVQARLVLAIYYATVDRLGEAGEMTILAISAAWNLRMNLELSEEELEEQENLQPQNEGGRGKATVGTGMEESIYPYGLSSHGFAECRRRTFWTCFIWERVHRLAAYPHQPTVMNPQDISLRLPYKDSSFEFEQADLVNTTPIVDLCNPPVVPQRPESGESEMSHLILVAADLGDIMDNTYRSAHRSLPADSSHNAFPAFRARAIDRLLQWQGYRRTDTVVYRRPSTPHQYGRNIAVVCQLALLILDRYVPQVCLTSQSGHPSTPLHREICVRNARDGAMRLLELVISAATPATTPIIPTTCALLEAVDILTATGTVADLPSLLERLARLPKMHMYADAVAQRIAMLERVFDKWDREGQTMRGPVYGAQVFLADKEDEEEQGTELRGKQPAGQRLVWRCEAPLVRRFPKEIDTIYGTPPLGQLASHRHEQRKEVGEP